MTGTSGTPITKPLQRAVLVTYDATTHTYA